MVVKKIFYISSYHDGYPSSDNITKGILETIKEENITLKVFFMDTKLNPGEEKVQVKVKEALKQIEKFLPDLVIAADDNAVKYIVQPHLKDIPVVFCGVNWSACQYELGDNVTGIARPILTSTGIFPTGWDLTSKNRQPDNSL